LANETGNILMATSRFKRASNLSKLAGTRSGWLCRRRDGLVRVPSIDVLPLEDAARAHQMIDTGHVRGKLVLKVAELIA